MLHYIIAFIIGTILAIITFFYITYKRNHHRTKCWVINLRKNQERLKRFMYYYNGSDLKDLPFERFEAIYGKDLDVQKYVSPKAYEVLLESEKNKYRTKHYQLTRGAVGCYLSHTQVIKKLVTDSRNDYYLIFEDDAALMAKVRDRFIKAIKNAPNDWDILLFFPIMEVVSQEDATYKKYESFWGLCAYAINKKGARKLTNELDNKPITMQIDSKMSHLIIQDKLNVYGYKEKLVWHGRNQGTDIQMPVKPQPDINPFILEDL